MKVGDLVDSGYAEIKTGPFGTQLRASDYVESGRPVLNVRNVGFGDVRAAKIEFVDEATAERLAGHILRTGDIVFGRKGAVERHAFIDSSFDGALQGSDCIRLRVSDDSPVPAAFITFALRTKTHQAWMQAWCSHGATMASLNQEIVRQIPLPQVDREAQQVAVHILQGIDDLIENNLQRIELLESMARAIYREWFVHFRFPGHEDVPMVDSDLGPIPDGWDTTRVGDFADICRTSLQPSKFPDETFDHFSIPAFDEAKLPSLDLGSAIRSNKYVIDSAAVLVSKLNPRIERTWLVTPGHKRRSISSTEFLILRPFDGISLEWLYLMVRSDGFQERLRELSGGTSTSHQRTRPNDFLNIREALPTQTLVTRFTDVVRPMLGEARSLIESNRELSAMRDLLLPKLVSGEIDVSGLDLAS